MKYRKEFYRIVDKVYELAKDFYKDKLITFAVFGSVASDSFRPDSDIDILIVAENLPRGRVTRVKDFIKNVEEKIEPELIWLYRNGIYISLSPVIKTPDEVSYGSPLFLDMTETIKILFDRDGFFKNYLERLKEKLRQSGARKVYFKGGYYWELKPDYKYGETVDI